MAFTIPPQGGQPTIKVFDSLDELQSETGQRTCHGFFDARSNTIFATADSIAHEVGHFLDVKSGKFKDPDRLQSSIEKIEACLRNEIVAVLFAYTKCGEGGTSLIHEARFIEWLRFSRKAQAFGPSPEASLGDLDFKQIQELGTWISASEHPWFDRIKTFFKTYLVDEAKILTYAHKSIRIANLND